MFTSGKVKIRLFGIVIFKFFHDNSFACLICFLICFLDV